MPVAGRQMRLWAMPPELQLFPWVPVERDSPRGRTCLRQSGPGRTLPRLRVDRIPAKKAIQRLVAADPRECEMPPGHGYRHSALRCLVTQGISPTARAATAPRASLPHSPHCWLSEKKHLPLPGGMARTRTFTGV